MQGQEAGYWSLKGGIRNQKEVDGHGGHNIIVAWQVIP